MSYRLFYSLFLVFFISCEKNDICVDDNANTPRVVLAFYDASLQDIEKEVSNLLVVGDSQELSYGQVASLTTVSLPLKISQDSTTYKLIKNYSVNDNTTPEDLTDDFIEGDVAIVTFSYERASQFVSKACGYKTIFKNLQVTIDQSIDNWITTSDVKLNTLEDETATHVHLYH